MPSTRGSHRGRALSRALGQGHQIVIRQAWPKGKGPTIMAELVTVDGEYEDVVTYAEGVGPQAALEELARKLSA